jgi:hypothetical protein
MPPSEKRVFYSIYTDSLKNSVKSTLMAGLKVKILPLEPFGMAFKLYRNYARVDRIYTHGIQWLWMLLSPTQP